MRADRIVVAAASALLVAGALFFAACNGDSTSNRNATTAVTSQATPAAASTVSQTRTTASYTMTLKVGAAEDILTPEQASTATSGEVLTQTAPAAVNTTTDPVEYRPPNRHLDVYVSDKASGAPATGVAPTLEINYAETGARRDLDVAAMYSVALGPNDAHFGNNLYLTDASYTMIVRVGQETAAFTVTLRGAPPATGTSYP